jgi:hypothetical protein
MTEDEAKTKWCPHVRAGQTYENFSANRDRDGTLLDYKHTCIASACMAWRWTAKPVEGKESYQKVVYDNESKLHRGVIVPAVEEVIGEGYCGLAGIPND